MEPQGPRREVDGSVGHTSGKATAPVETVDSRSIALGVGDRLAGTPGAEHAEPL